MRTDDDKPKGRIPSRGSRKKGRLREERFLVLEKVPDADTGAERRPAPIMQFRSPALVQGQARDAFAEHALPFLIDVLKGSLYKVRRTVLNRETGAVTTTELEISPEIEDKLRAADLLGKYGRLQSTVVTNADGSDVDKDQADLAWAFIQALQTPKTA